MPFDIDHDQPSAEATTKPGMEQAKKAGEWVASLKLDDRKEERRLKDVAATHLKAVRDCTTHVPAPPFPLGSTRPTAFA